MTTDNREVRDELRKMMGFTQHEPPGGGEPFWTHESSRDPIYEDPCPNTLDAADAAMPEGWDWVRVPLPSSTPFPGRVVFHWYATNSTFSVEVPDTGDRKADLFALALAARKAQEPRNV